MRNNKTISVLLILALMLLFAGCGRKQYKQEPATVKAIRLVFVASGDAEELPKLLSQMDNKMKLVALNTRPAKTKLGEYNYLIECADCSYEDLLKVKENIKLEIRYLGSFDVK